MEKLELYHRGVSIAVFVESCGEKWSFILEIDGVFDKRFEQGPPPSLEWATRKAVQRAQHDIDQTSRLSSARRKNAHYAQYQSKR